MCASTGSCHVKGVRGGGGGAVSITYLQFENGEIYNPQPAQLSTCAMHQVWRSELNHYATLWRCVNEGPSSLAIAHSSGVLP